MFFSIKLIYLFENDAKVLFIEYSFLQLFKTEATIQTRNKKSTLYSTKIMFII